MAESTAIKTQTHRCYGSGRPATWDPPDSHGKIQCPHCGQRVRVEEPFGLRTMRRMAEHDALGGPE